MFEVQEHKDGLTILSLNEDNLTAANASRFKHEVIQLIEQGRLRLIIDLRGVKYVDSSGLGALVGVLKRLGAKGELAVCSVAPAVMAVFKLTRMDRVFQIAPDPESAALRLEG